MTIRTFVDKHGNEWNWQETPEVVKAIKNFHAPHPHIKKNGKETD
jgi:hypothetical protein